MGDWWSAVLLTDTCNILRETRTPKPSGSGGASITFPAAHSGVPCAVIDAGTPTEQTLASQTVGSAPKLVLLPRGTDVLDTDRIQVGAITYHIIDAKGPDTIEVLRQVLVSRLSIT